LRCLGATPRQLRRSVALEAVVTGGIGALAGIGAGWTLVEAGLLGARRFFPHAPVPALAPVTWLAFAIPLAAGLGTTLIAAQVPARLATRVAPMAALRPQSAPTLKKAAGKARLITSLVLAIGGAAALFTTFALTTAAPETEVPTIAGTTALAMLGIGGAVLCLIGIMVSAVFWMPKTITLTTRLLAKAGPTARLAAANTARNPRRTAATTSALVIGVTLIAFVSAGAATIERSLLKGMDTWQPLDIVAGQLPYTDYAPFDATPEHLPLTTADFNFAALPAGFIAEAAEAPGISGAATIHSAALAVSPEKQPEVFRDEYGAIIVNPDSDTEYEAQQKILAPYTSVAGIDPDTLAKIAHSSADADALRAGKALISESAAERRGLRPDAEITVTAGQQTRAYRVQISDLAGSLGDVVVPATDLAALEPDAPATMIVLGLAAEADARATVGAVTKAASNFTTADGYPPYIYGAAVERESWKTAIRITVLAIMGLLGIALVVALVGIANTLSLSIVERRRENAVLRAIGLTRRQMRSMLALEGVAIALIGAVVGLVIGIFFAWTGAYLVMKLDGDAEIGLYPAHVAAVLVIALAAGVLASILPGRQAAQTPPAAALGAE
jgi:putative ABC transport system permease protein